MKNNRRGGEAAEEETHRQVAMGRAEGKTDREITESGERWWMNVCRMMWKKKNQLGSQKKEASASLSRSPRVGH